MLCLLFYIVDRDCASMHMGFVWCCGIGSVHTMCVVLPAPQEYEAIVLQSQRAEAAQRKERRFGSWSGYDNGPRRPRGKPLFKLLQEALLSERDLQSISGERLQYTQLLHRWAVRFWAVQSRQY
jgi:hypothetical protein